MLKLKNPEIKLIKFTCLLIVLVFYSCKSKQELIEYKLVGSWDIVDMNYEEKKYIDNLLINGFTIDKNGIIIIPDTINSKIEDANIISTWSVKQERNNQFILSIDCKKNQAFNGNFKISFFKNNVKKLLGIELKSEKTIIYAYKILQNFDTDGKNWENN